MNEQLDKINQGANFFEEFIRVHPLVSAMIAATVLSWVLTAAIKPWMLRGPNRARNLRTLDVALAAIAAALMMRQLLEWRWLICFALLVGGASPFLYWAWSEALCWKFPKARRFLTLSELGPESDSTDQAAATADPPPDHNETL